MAVTNNPFYSKYGFDAPGFAVDEQGNVTVKSLTSETLISDVVQQVDDTLTTIQYTVTESGGNFEISGELNPTLSIIRGRTYRFNLTLTSIGFNIKDSDGLDVTTGIQHVYNGTTLTGADAQNKGNGYLEWSVPTNASGFYYANTGGNVSGLFTFTDPEITGTGSFSSLLVTGSSEFRDDVTITADITGQTLALSNTTQSTTTTTGTLTVAGGVGIAKNLNVGGSIVADDFLSSKVGIPTLSSGTNLDLKAKNAITFTIDNIEQGRLTVNGFYDIDMYNGTVNNTVIGNDVPNDGTFTNLIMNQAPTLKEHVTRKDYVDSNDIVFSIAFGA